MSSGTSSKFENILELRTCAQTQFWLSITTIDLKRLFNSILLLISFMLAMNAYAQEVLVSDSATIYPFEGTITYQISYSGKVDPLKRSYLADSVTLFVGKSAMCYVYHGGIADELLTKMLWDADSQKLWLINAGQQTADSFPDYYKGLPYKSKKQNEKAKVAGYSVNSYALIAREGNNKVWVTDSIFFGGHHVDSLKAFQPPFISAGKPTIPLQSVRTNEAGIVIKMKAVQVIPGVLEEKWFEIPDNFEKGPFNPFEVRHPLISK